MDIEKKEKCFKAWFKKEYLGIDNLANQGDEGAITRRDYAYVGWKAAKAQAVPGWVSVENKLPIDGQDVIAFDAIKHCVFKGGEFLQGYIESDTGHEYEEPVEVTHWMAVETQEPAND
ncbi:DUF551 domain-containing protein [Acinetobacter sp. CS-2]|uniref:DUF551 domain-containing protein n=1 Tax=Acinetobacter sp. CS-2 TaxID=2798861 RepID=UPI0019077D50|nr:DUF551 domain-containing protein [Acinetobacter sp. CS-2]QQN40508.1 DUF551 domain-containing protein [Acinetobacter sp. CS-2]